MSWITMVPTADISRLAPLLDVLNVRFLIFPVPGPDRVKVELRTTVWPRAFFVDGVTTYTDAQDFMRKVAAAGKPLAAVQARRPRSDRRHPWHPGRFRTTSLRRATTRSRRTPPRFTVRSVGIRRRGVERNVHSARLPRNVERTARAVLSCQPHIQGSGDSGCRRMGRAVRVPAPPLESVARHGRRWVGDARGIRRRRPGDRVTSSNRRSTRSRPLERRRRTS